VDINYGLGGRMPGSLLSAESKANSLTRFYSAFLGSSRMKFDFDSGIQTTCDVFEGSQLIMIVIINSTDLTFSFKLQIRLIPAC